MNDEYMNLYEKISIACHRERVNVVIVVLIEVLLSLWKKKQLGEQSKFLLFKYIEEVYDYKPKVEDVNEKEKTSAN